MTGRIHIPFLLGVLTVAENAVPRYGLNLWYEVVAPAGKPSAVIGPLNADLRKTIASPEVGEAGRIRPAGI